MKDIRMAKVNRLLILKTTSNYGEIAKQRVILLESDLGYSVQIKRYLLCDLNDNNKTLKSGELIKKYKGKGLYLNEFAIKLDTFSEIFAWLGTSKENTVTIMKQNE